MMVMVEEVIGQTNVTNIYLFRIPAARPPAQIEAELGPLWSDWLNPWPTRLRPTKPIDNNRIMDDRANRFRLFIPIYLFPIHSPLSVLLLCCRLPISSNQSPRSRQKSSNHNQTDRHDRRNSKRNESVIIFIKMRLLLRRRSTARPPVRFSLPIISRRRRFVRAFVCRRFLHFKY